MYVPCIDIYTFKKKGKLKNLRKIGVILVVFGLFLLLLDESAQSVKQELLVVSLQH